MEQALILIMFMNINFLMKQLRIFTSRKTSFHNCIKFLQALPYSSVVLVYMDWFHLWRCSAQKKWASAKCWAHLPAILFICCQKNLPCLSLLHLLFLRRLHIISCINGCRIILTEFHWALQFLCWQLSVQ